MPRSRKALPGGVGVEILASIYAHHHDSGKQFTVQDAAEMIGVAWPTLDAWLKGTSVPRLDQARRLARFMGLSLDELAGRFYRDDLSGILAPREATGTSAARATPVVDVEHVRELARLTAKRRGVGAKKEKRQGEGGRS
jgi:hypothetical protein